MSIEIGTFFIFAKGRAGTNRPARFFSKRRLFKHGEICIALYPSARGFNAAYQGVFGFFRGAGQRLQVAEAVCMEKVVFPRNFHQLALQACRAEEGENSVAALAAGVYFLKGGAYFLVQPGKRGITGDRLRARLRGGLRLLRRRPAGDGRVPARIGAEGGQKRGAGRGGLRLASGLLQRLYGLGRARRGRARPSPYRR